MDLPQLGFRSMGLLADLLGGAALSGHVRESMFSAGRGTARTEAGLLAVQVVPHLALDLRARTRLDGPVQATGQSLRLQLSPLRGSAAEQLGHALGSFVTRYSLIDPQLRPRAYACANTRTQVALTPDQTQALSGECFEADGDRDQLAIIDGPAALTFGNVPGHLTPLRFDRASVLVARGVVGVAGGLREQPFHVHAGACTVSIKRHAGGRPFSALFRAGDHLAFEAEVAMEKVWLPLSATDESVIVTANRPAILRGGAATPTTDPAGAVSVLVDGVDVVAMALDGTQITLRRGSDLFNMTFQLTGFKLVIADDRRVHIHRVGDWSGHYQPATITVLLPPQHIGEHSVNVDGGCPMPDSSIDQARFAEPSRIVFKLPAQQHATVVWREVALTVDALTDWSGLSSYLSLQPRADVGDDLKSQLMAAGLDATAPGQRLDEALKRIQASLLAPKPDETSLELAAKLLFSPGRRVTWERPGQAQDRAVTLFGLRIGHTADPGLRAIWSTLLTEGSFPPQHPSTTPPDRVTLSQADHWGIVGQTSVYGLPALRRITGNPPIGGIGGVLAKVPRGGVVRPDPPPTYLTDLDTALARQLAQASGQPMFSPAPPETGISLATTFEAADITMTALGATMRIEWRGDPPQIEPNETLSPQPVPGFQLERLAYSTWLARDERVTAVQKGFLFPYGFRAALLQTAQRAYVPDPSNPDGTVAIEIRRRRIVTHRPTKTFPALNQPDGGRDWAAASMTLLTDITPYLVDPNSADGGSIVLPGLDSGYVFWPQVRVNATQAVDFDWKTQVDDDPTPLVSRMLFVSSAVITDPNLIAQLVKLFNDPAIAAVQNGNSWPARNVASLFGARRRYADSIKEGDTSFDTDSWLVIARGRSLGSGEGFLMDARMNGADQPPFYPSMLRMRIAVQSIDRLVGKPQGLIVCKPDPRYVSADFTDHPDDPQIFINVVSPRIAFDVSGVGQVSGGVAQPLSLVAAISRTAGIIGGSDSGARIAGRLGLRPELSTSTEVALNFGAAKQNNFSVAEFFNGGFQILGINLIDQIVNTATASLSAAPTLIEQISYGVTDAAGQNVLARIQSIAAAAATAIDQLLVSGSNCTTGPCGTLDAAIELVNAGLPQNLSHNLTFQSLYPDFFRVYTQTKQAGIPDLLRMIASAQRIEDVPGPATQVLAKGRPLVNAIEALLANPVPQQFEQVISNLSTEWATLQSAIHDGVAGVCQALAEQILAQMLAPALATLTPDEEMLIFGQQVSGAPQIIAALRDPSLASRIAQTLFYESFGEALLRVGSIARQLDAQVNGQVSLARANLVDAVSDLIGTAVGALSQRLDPQGQPNILDAPTQRALAVDVVATVDQALQQLQPQRGQSPNQIRTTLGTLANQLSQVLAARIAAAITARAGWFRPRMGESATQILADFTQAVRDRIEAAVLDEVTTEVAGVIALVNDYEAHAERRARQAIDVIIANIQGACDIARFNQINEFGLQVLNWCTDAANGVLPVAQNLGDGLLADSATIAQTLADIVNKAATIPTPTAPPPVQQAFDAGRHKLLTAAANLTPLLDQLSQARQVLASLTTASVCAPGAELIRAVDAAVRARVAALPLYGQIARGLDDMQGAIGRALPATGPLDDLLNSVRGLLGQITTVNEAGGAGNWGQVSTAVTKLQTALADPKYAAYVQTLRDASSRLTSNAAQLRQALATAGSADLLGIIDRVAGEYSNFDRLLSGAILQTVAFASPALAQLDTAAFSMLQGIAGAIEALEKLMLQALGQLLSAINSDALVRYLLSVLGLSQFQDAVNKLAAEKDALDAIAHAPDLPTAVAWSQVVLTKWQGGDVPLLTVFDQFLQLIDTIFQGKVDKLLADSVRAAVNQLKEQLLSVLSQIVPTKISTGYNWVTQLKSGDIFQVLEPERMDHLSLSSNIEFNFLNNHRTARMVGTLQAFSITLPNMVIISFEPVTFTAGTDRNTSFDVRVRGVELGTYLSFLDALSAWMRPSGSGFYVTPGFADIQVGYIYASDLISVGELEFINIAVEVYARLPFGSGGAKFGFKFASEERPFLIAAPPYGGGGYFLMETDASGSIENMTLMFLFGAVVAFNFSILSGSGRVVAGVSFTQRKSGLTLRTIFEAVGEGHIACFSLSIYIRIVLTHYDTGDLEGQATLSFTFKMGFFSIGYTVTAERRIAGHGGQQQRTRIALVGPRAMALALPAVGGQFKLATSSPVKSQQWKAYRRHIALDLIDDTRPS